MLVNMRDLLKDAVNGNYAVGSFSVANMEMVLGVLKAAEELNAPVILQIAEVRLISFGNNRTFNGCCGRECKYSCCRSF